MAASCQHGFALIATISVMVLLTMIALAMLSLSTTELRNSGHNRERQQAQANARMALMIALGELQAQLGPDQRISAPASILDGNKKTATIDDLDNPGWLGVWDARIQSSQNPSYEEGREKSFRTWLVSSPSDKLFQHAKSFPLNTSNSVVMIPDDSKHPETRAALVEIAPNKGKYAWHVEDNSMRARADLPHVEAGDTATMIARRGATVRHAPEVIDGMETLPTTKEQLNRLVSLNTLPLALEASKPADDSWKQALTTRSTSLLVDVVDGSWRKDMNTLLEQTDLEDFKSLGYGDWEGKKAFKSKKAYLYGPERALGARWSNLHSYYNLYKRISFNSGVPQIKPKGQLINWWRADRGESFGDPAGGFSFPRIAKIAYVFSYSSKPGRTPGKLELELVTDVFVTFWNPYNTKIIFPTNTCMLVKFSKYIPMKFGWYVNDQSKGASTLDKLILGTALYDQPRLYRPQDGNLFSMEPGETVVFSKRFGNFHPGVHFGQGRKVGVKIEGNPNDRISVSLSPAKNDIFVANQSSAQYLDFWILDNSKGWPFYEHRGEVIAKAEVPFIQQLSTIDKDDVPSVTFAEVLGNKQPFGAFSVEIKTAGDSENPAMAFLQSGISRLSSRAGKEPGEWNAEKMDYRLEAVTSFNDDILQVTVPSHAAGPYHGFIGSGRTFGTGVTHVMHAGAPLLPLTSLAEFQHAGVGDEAPTIRATHWGLSSTPFPPYTDYAVGNSYAHPLVAKDSKKTGNYYDHSYYANEVLWDHYFCSSLAPQTQSIFKEKREMKQVWSDFLNLKKPMLNPRFRPYRGGESISKLEDEVFTNDKIVKEAYQSIASNLLYDGGFNVNSTSVGAWKAFLSGSRHDQLRILEAFKPIATAATTTATGTPFSRTKLPLGKAINSRSINRQNLYLGYRDLTDDQITELAEKVVEQVKTRGPFLSLSDFINRQLSSNVDLAKSGTLQAAIDATDINKEVAATGMAVSGDGKGFNFPDAATGNTAAGSPGWLMQSDLLTPLGASIFVRGDTFTIRAYGDVRDSKGRVVASARCEAIVQRFPDYVDPRDDNAVSTPTQTANIKFGREFRILQFRWISTKETL